MKLPQTRQTNAPINAYGISVSADDLSSPAVATASVDEGEIAVNVRPGQARTVRVVAYATPSFSVTRQIGATGASGTSGSTIYVGAGDTYEGTTGASGSSGETEETAPSVDVIVPPSGPTGTSNTADTGEGMVNLGAAVATYYGENTVDLADAEENVVTVRIFPAGTLVVRIDALAVATPQVGARLYVKNNSGAQWALPLISSDQRQALPVDNYVIDTARFTRETALSLLSVPTFSIGHGRETVLSLVFGAPQCDGVLLCGRCGDGVVVPPEECDDGNNVSADGCTKSCSLEGAPPGCGNGVLEYPEQCDDMNVVAGDGCSARCEDETAALRCGNGKIEFPEDCDDGNHEGGDGCSPDCVGENAGAYCGNGEIDAGEACDDGNTNWLDGCTPVCRMPTLEEYCGDGRVQAGEQCDLGLLNGQGLCNTDCYLPSGSSGPTGPSNTAQVCGDGITSGTEVCDDGNFLDGDACSSDCRTMGGTSGMSGPS